MTTTTPSPPSQTSSVPKNTASIIRYVPTASDLDPRRAARRRRTIELVLAWGVPIVVILAWQVAAQRNWMDTRFFPAPTSIWTATVEAHQSGVLWPNVWITVQRILIGFAFGVISGVIAGLALGMSRLLRAAFEPLLGALYTVPKLALLPMFLLIFGLGEKPRIIVIAITVFFFVWISTMAAVQSVDAGSQEALLSMGANRRQLFRHVIGPAIMPTVFVSMRVSAGVAVLVTIGLEFVQANTGIGAVTWKSWSLFLAARMYAGIITIALIGLCFTMTVTAIGRLATPWAPRERVVGRS